MHYTNKVTTQSFALYLYPVKIFVNLTHIEKKNKENPITNLLAKVV